MIKEIIKRNGSDEPFSAQKVNGWGEWAAEHLGDKVDWATIVGDAVAALPERVSSQELQEELIQQCLDKKTWSYYRMAGRLYAALLFKKIYGDEIPTVKALHRRLQGLKLLAHLDYSDEEYAMVEELIDHDRDYHCPHFSLHHSREKYALKNRITGEEYETQQFMYMRMAMAMAEDEPRDTRMKHLTKWYEHLSAKRMSAPTPNYTDFGTPRPGLASCCLLVTGDDGPSLAITSYAANIMTQANAGIGINLITRGVDEPVRNGTIKHLGKKAYMDEVAKSILANTKNGRGGAGTLFFNAFDPQAEFISQLRNPRQTEDKKNRDLHYNMMQNKFFATKVAAKNPADRLIFTWSCRTAPDLHQAFYAGDIKNFVEIYKRYEADPLFKKNYIDARELILTSLNEAFETGTAYLSFMDEINRHTPFKDTIYSSNLCVAPETQILTDEGYVQIQAKAGQQVNVWNGQEWSAVDVVKTGENQELLLVATDSGENLECTPYHKFYVVDDYGLAPREVRAHELKTGDKLIKFDLPVVGGSEQLDKAYVNGFYTGAGCLTRQGQRIYLYGEKQALAPEFEYGSQWTYQPEQSRVYTHFTDLKDKFFVPLNGYTVASRLEWLAGYVDADGSIQRNGDNQQLVMASVNSAFLREVQLMLNTLGVGAKLKLAHDGSGALGDFDCQATWRLLITSADLQQLGSLGFAPKRLNIHAHQPQRDAKPFIKVLGVFSTGRMDDTYCFTEHKRGMGIFNGLLTGQCAEVTEPTAPYYQMEHLYSDN